MASMLRYVQARGYRRIVCIGSSLGGAACELAAQQPGMAGFILLSGVTPREFDPGLDLHFEKITYPVLIFVSETEGFSESNRWFFDQVRSQEKRLVLIPGSTHTVMETSYASTVRNQIIQFVDSIQ
jgi:esterase/lipase